MKRAIAAALIAALCLALCAPALAEETVSARTSVSGQSQGKGLNILHVATLLNGTSVPSGARISFNELIGPCTEGNNYFAAPNGAGVTVVGGGVEQAATTLYLALSQLGNDVYFDEKHTYGERFADGYVPDGSNAIQLDEAAGLDFCFTNLGRDLMIGMVAQDGYLSCTLTLSAALSDVFLPWSGPGPQLRAAAASASIALDGTDAMVNNVQLAASSINDTVLDSGDLFSFNDTVGPRSERFGYQSALNGRGVKVVGGGVAQVASAIWLAVKNLDGVAIVEKSTYGKRYNQHYVSSSNDAILTDYGGDTDFSFRNTGDSPMTIATYVRDGVLYCEIYRD